MGIQGLLPLLKSIMKPIHIKELEGCFVAVDTYSWLHKGAICCSTELCKGQPTFKHIDYCMHRVNMLRHYGVKPILVFDGGPLPMKSEQEIKRSRSRKENLSRALEHESNGNLSAAYECYQKAVDISPIVAYELIQVLKQENVSYIVAPYEADAQMTFLALNKYVEAVVTEDSDLIAFGCPRIIYKMDKYGQGVEFKNSMLQHNKELNFAGFTQMMLLEMCILSGCDYLQSLVGLGLKKAYTLMKKFRSHEKVIKHLEYSGVEVPSQYEESFKKAILTFRHQRVYDPFNEFLVHLYEPPADILVEDLDFLGPMLPRHIAKGIAQGDLDPFTQMSIKGESGVGEHLLQGAYQIKSFKSDGKTRKLELPAQKNLLTNYFCLTSLEAKRTFRAPRITPNHSSESNETSSPHMLVEKVKHNRSPDNMNSLEAKVHGQCDSNGAVNHSGIKLSTALESAACKPCILLHKDIDSDLENGKTVSGNKTKILRSRYFMKDSDPEHGKRSKSDVDNNNDFKLENVVSNNAYDPLPALFESGEEKQVAVRSSYFQRNIRKNVNLDQEKALGAYSVHTPTSDLGADDCKTTDNGKHKPRSSYAKEKPIYENKEECESVELVVRGGAEYSVQTPIFGLDAGERKTDRKHRVRSSYFDEISVSENSENCEYEKLVVGGGPAVEPCNYGIDQSPRSNYSLECSRKRNLAQRDSQTEGANDNDQISGKFTSDPEEETKGEGKFSCNISHLARYSEIADKSMEKFASVISSFRYNSSGTRASGLRAPLKDVKNNFLKRPKLNMDLRTFLYTPAREKTPSTCQKTKV